MDYSNFKFSKPKTKKHKTETVKSEVYDEVYKRDGGRCRLCGAYNIELHHINGRGKNLTNSVNNCIMLCSYCHRTKVHGNLKKYRPILNEMVGNK